MFLGTQPPLFYAEIALRCLIIYGYTFLALRWIGGRSVAQLSLVEFLLVIALGSAVGDPLFYPEVPLLHALAVITIIALINKLVDMAIVRWNLAKRLVDGGTLEVVRDGHIRAEAIRRRQMGPAELKSLLRQKGVRNLGEIEYAFIEAGGAMSLFRRSRPHPGLPIVPPEDIEPPLLVDPPQGEIVCVTCGRHERGETLKNDPVCKTCGNRHWTRPR